MLSTLSVIPRPSHGPVFDRLQCAKMEREGMVHFITSDVSVYLGILYFLPQTLEFWTSAK